MAKNFIWCGYLEAGDKSSPVVEDKRLDTGNPETMYLFNLKRNGILTYNRGIVAPKLRELRDDESEVMQELKGAFAKARRGFKLRSEPVTVSHTSGRRQKAVNEKVYADSEEDVSAIGAEIEAVTDDDWGTDDNDE